MAAQDAFIEGQGPLPVLIKTARAGSAALAESRGRQPEPAPSWVLVALGHAGLRQRSISRPGDRNLPLHPHPCPGDQKLLLHPPSPWGPDPSPAPTPAPAGPLRSGEGTHRGRWRAVHRRFGGSPSLVAPGDVLGFTTPEPNLRGPSHCASMQTPELPAVGNIKPPCYRRAARLN